MNFERKKHNLKKRIRRLTQSSSPSLSLSSSHSNMSFEEETFGFSSQISPQSIALNSGTERLKHKNKELFSINRESKIEIICSLASLLNIRNLEQNSRILLDLSQSKENCDILIQSKNSQIVIKLIFDEWHELFEYFNACKEKLKNNFSFFIFENRKNLTDLLSRRLAARRLAELALDNLIQNEYQTNNEIKINLLELIFKIIKFNETIFEHLINSIKTNSNRLVDKLVFSEEKCDLIKYLLNELSKQSSIEQRLSLVELGAAQAICELIEVVWIFDDSTLISMEFIHQITYNCIKILSSLINIKNSDLISDLIKQLCSRRQWLNSVYNCLHSQLNSKPDFEIVKTISYLIKHLSSHLNSNSKNRLDESSLALISFNDINFSDIFTQYAVNYSQAIRPDDLKPILSSLLNLSILSFDNKKTICHIDGSLKLFIELLRSDSKILSRQIEEISISLLRSLCAYYSINEKIRSELRNLNFYDVLLNHSLTSSNLNVVANACNILWSISTRSKHDQELLISLGAETRLRVLSNSSFDFISISSLAALKNLTSNSQIGPCKAIFSSSASFSSSISSNSSANTDKSLNLSDSITSSSSTCSSFSCQLNSQPILINRSRRQMIESSNEFQKKLKECDYFKSSSSLSLSNSSSSRSRSSSLSSSSSSSSICFSSKIKKNSYYLNEHLDKKRDDVKKTKHVTFSGKEILLFEIPTSSCDSISTKTSTVQSTQCSIEIIEPEKNIKQNFSPPLNLKFIKSNSLLLNKSLFSNDESDCLIANCNSFIAPIDELSNENKENESDIVFTPKQRLESNASLSLLLEPAMELINKMDAKLNQEPIKTISILSKKVHNFVPKSSRVIFNNKPLDSAVLNPPLLPTRTTSLHRKSLKQKSKSQPVKTENRSSVKNTTIVTDYLNKKQIIVGSCK